MISLRELADKIKGEKSVAVFCHVRPDGDTIGSALGLKLALEFLGIKTGVFCDDPIPPRFSFLTQTSQIKNEFSGEYTALIAIDCADIQRLGDFAPNFTTHKNTYALDHHVSNTRFAKVNCVLDNASNCENVFELIKFLGVEINEEMANCLALGIVTDTGNFKHNNVTSETLYRMAQLVEKGANLNAIIYNMFTAQSKERAQLFGVVMQKIRYFFDGKFALATVRLADFALTGATQDQTEGFIDFVMGIEGVEVGACVMEMSPNKFKISLRAKTVDVNAVASTFGGGGHKLASGCQIQGEYEEVVDKLQFAVSREIPD